MLRWWLGPDKIWQRWKIKLTYHVLNYRHSVDKTLLKLDRLDIEKRLLDAYETLEIIEGYNLLGKDGSPVPVVYRVY